MKILITGGTGFIVSNLAAEFAVAQFKYEISN